MSKFSARTFPTLLVPREYYKIAFVYCNDINIFGYNIFKLE